MPKLADPNFHKAVTYICEHNEQGAVGIVINQPLDICLSDVLDQMNISYDNPDLAKIKILYGGPIHRERGFVIHKTSSTWESSFITGNDISVTTSRDILQSIADNKGPKDVIISLGYAGWGAGQLEKELSRNAWLNCTATEDILFKTPFDKRWAAAGTLIGIDINNLSDDIGHA